MSKTNKNVFIVDDDASVLKSLHRLLRSAGFNVEAFHSGQAFLDSIPFDTEGCLLLDLCMPDINGFELQERLNSYGSRLHIIIITAHAQAGDREKAMKKGAVGFLRKPFDDQSLIDLINTALQRVTEIKKNI